MNLVTSLIAMGIIFTPLGALYWSTSLGYYSSTPANLFCSLASLVGVLKIFLNLQPSLGQVIKVNVLKIWFFGFITSLISLIFLGYNELYIYKTLSLSLLYLTWFSPLICYSEINVSKLKIPLLISILIMIVGILCVDLKFFNSSIVELFISPDFYNIDTDSIAGFMEEPSHFASTFGLLICSFYLVSKHNRIVTNRSFIFFIIFLSIVLIFLDSKGAVFSIVFSLVFSQKLKIKNLIYFLIVIPIVYIGIAAKLPLIVSDIETFSSVATRTTFFVLGVFAGITNPLGWGYYGYYGVFQNLGPTVLSLAISESLILNEVYETITNLTNVSTKSSFLDLFILYGWGFIYIIYKGLDLLNTKDLITRFGLLFIFFTSLYTAGNQLYLDLLLLSLLFKRSEFLRCNLKVAITRYK